MNLNLKQQYIIPCDLKKVDFRETNLPEQNIFIASYFKYPIKPHTLHIVVLN